MRSSHRFKSRKIITYKRIKKGLNQDQLVRVYSNFFIDKMNSKNVFSKPYKYEIITKPTQYGYNEYFYVGNFKYYVEGHRTRAQKQAYFDSQKEVKQVKNVLRRLADLKKRLDKFSFK
ncbi:hypothetical protein [Candidatus Phytoplasma pini]|uniref:Uncharacterized protein n=1 Tax=Candidatus Phytoplasma pini TaxID=267362 RepID=A0A559KIY2_9MOLU|nr:hypothetical protein [Candidatus Phytoplasma pini]TVY12086.1 hypothetical protein MDPP_00373 [Candidatus Phytoplasma pini]